MTPMMFTRAVLFGGLLTLATAAWAANELPGGGQQLSPVGTTAPAPAEPVALEPRLKPNPIPSDRLQVTEWATGRLVVKFQDDLRARISAKGGIRSASNLDVQPVNDVLAQYGLQLQPGFNQDEEKIASILRRAELHSGRHQPDLAGMMFIQVDHANLLTVARALNDLAEVEWVEIEEKRFPGATPFGGGPVGACCLPDNTCVPDQTQGDCTVLLGGFYMGDGEDCGTGCGACCLPPANECQPRTVARCAAEGGTFQGFAFVCPGSGFCGACCLPQQGETFPCVAAVSGSCDAQGGLYTSDGTPCAAIDCEELNDTGCGDLIFGNCFLPGGNGSPYCDDLFCCNRICESADPFCCDEDNGGEWDDICVELANLLCDAPPADRCATQFNGNCFEAHPGGGCDDSLCCNLICGLEQGCCDNEWDSLCALLALELCLTPADPEDPTPDFEPFQAHLTAAPLNPFAFTGFNGVGLNLRTAGEPFDDLNGNGWWDPGEPFTDLNGNGVWDGPGGVYGLAEELLHVYGIDESGMGNLTRGRTIRVGVIEWAFYEGHEDLDVTVEAGQTLITIPEVTEPDHGTASLGVIGARDDGTGVVGVAPEVELHFFPLTSVEQGPRETSAWLSAIDFLRAGDVISCSYGPPTNLNNSLQAWTLIRLAADLGITACIAAGNSCINLDNADDLGDSGGIVVGACSPGTPHYRLAFSNYHLAPDPGATRSNVVHLRAWGSNVVTTGYGDLFAPAGPPGSGVNPLRAYTATYGGTSAAAPQIAGCVAILQGFAKQFYGIPLATDRIRDVMRNGDPPTPGPRGLPGGFEEGPLCGLDSDPELGPHRAGTFPNLAGSFDSAASRMLNQTSAGFDDSPLLQNILIANGTWIFGNRFSVKGVDNNYLVIESRYVNRNKPFDSAPGLNEPPRVGLSFDDVPEAKRMTYLASGQITDVVAVGRSTLENPTAMAVTVIYGPVDVFSLGFIEAFNFTTRRWQFLNLSLLDAGAPGAVIEGTALNANSFIRNEDGRILVRTWTLGFGFESPQLGGTTYRTRIDLIGIDVDTVFGEQ